MPTNYLKKQGESVTLSLTFKDCCGCAIDICQYTVFLTLKNRKTDADCSAVVCKTITQHTAPACGLTQIALTNAETCALAGTYFYDMKYKTGSGQVKYIDNGVFTFLTMSTIRTA